MFKLFTDSLFEFLQFYTRIASSTTTISLYRYVHVCRDTIKSFPSVPSQPRIQSSHLYRCTIVCIYYSTLYMCVTQSCELLTFCNRNRFLYENGDALGFHLRFPFSIFNNLLKIHFYCYHSPFLVVLVFVPGQQSIPKHTFVHLYRTGSLRYTLQPNLITIKSAARPTRNGWLQLPEQGTLSIIYKYIAFINPSTLAFTFNIEVGGGSYSILQLLLRSILLITKSSTKMFLGYEYLSGVCLCGVCLCVKESLRN